MIDDRIVGVASCLALAAGCGAPVSAREPLAGRAPATAEPRPVVGELRCQPTLDDADVNMDGVIDEPVTLSWCTGPSKCRPVVEIPAGRRVADYSASRDGRFAVIKGGEPGKADTLAFFDLTTARMTGQADLAGQGTADDLVLQKQWTAGDHLLLTWSAGSFVAAGTLYDVHGRHVLDLEAPAIDVSPDGRYMLAYQAKGAPVVDDGMLDAYDLATARAISLPHMDVRAVLDLHWTADAVTLDYESTLGGSRSTRLALADLDRR